MAVYMGDNLMRPSARASDILLPTTLLGENPAAFNVEHNQMFYFPTASTPQGEVRTSTWVAQQLANLLGYGSQYSSALTNVSWANWYSTYQTLCQTAYNTWASSVAVQL